MTGLEKLEQNTGAAIRAIINGNHLPVRDSYEKRLELGGQMTSVTRKTTGRNYQNPSTRYYSG